ncbi:DeoR family transcriptional regulator [Paenibacillus cymbidii]
MRIVELLERKSSISVSELMKLFGVSIETVRRDLEYLENQR